MPFAHNGPVELYYETFGDDRRPVLLLVNGLGSQCLSYDVELCEMFAHRGFHVVRFDNRDVGLSSKFDEFVPDVQAVNAAMREGMEPRVAYLLSDMANDAAAVLDALGVERAHVVGASMGGMIAQQLVIDHPRRCHSITSIMSTTGDPDVGQASPEVAKLFFGPRPMDRESAIASGLALSRLYASPAFFDESRFAKRVGDAFDRFFCPYGVARQLSAITASGSRTAALSKVRLAALVLHGDRDTLVDASGGRRTADAIAGARFVEIAGMGHDLPPELWDRLVDLITEHALSAASIS